MTDRPILFSGPMVAALLDGRKTMTRRLAKSTSPWRNVQPGDRLWVREGFADMNGEAVYRQGHHEANGFGPRVDVRWRPSIHMPRWANRLTLTVTATRVERLHEITEADAEREGWPGVDADSYVSDANPVIWFARLWVGLHGPGSWDASPEVVALTFTVARRNIDQ